jgi:hypothetical protein
MPAMSGDRNAQQMDRGDGSRKAAKAQMVEG